VGQTGLRPTEEGIHPAGSSYAEKRNKRGVNAGRASVDDDRRPQREGHECEARDSVETIAPSSHEDEARGKEARPSQQLNQGPTGKHNQRTTPCHDSSVTTAKGNASCVPTVPGGKGKEEHGVRKEKVAMAHRSPTDDTRGFRFGAATPFDMPEPDQMTCREGNDEED
jgi:hypothetical protein